MTTRAHTIQGNGKGGLPSALLRKDAERGEGDGRTKSQEFETGGTRDGRGTPGLVVRLSASGIEVPLVIGPSQWKKIVGDPRSTHSIRLDCETGRIPTLSRGGGSGSHHRIVVAKALDELGVSYEIVPRSP